MICKGIAILAFAAAAGSSGAQQQADRQTTEFLKAAIEGNIAEVQIGTLAEQRASDDVRELASMIVEDHRKALDKSSSIAEDMGVEIPENPSPKAQAEYDRLAQQSDSAFERQFVDLMVKNHQSTVEKYRAYTESAEGDSEAVAYAKNTLPTLEKHLEEAKSLNDQAGEQ